MEADGVAVVPANVARTAAVAALSGVLQSDAQERVTKVVSFPPQASFLTRQVLVDFFLLGRLVCLRQPAIPESLLYLSTSSRPTAALASELCSSI
jgi:hypothetical protein